MRRGEPGFQLAVRNSEDRTQAGDVTISDDKRLGILDERGVQFVQHRLTAAPATGEDTVRWQIAWSAPKSAGRVTLHAAAVAGDGDESQAGDYVYTLAAKTESDPAAE